MTNSIALGPDGQVNHTLSVLRNESRKGALAKHVPLLPGVDLHIDPALRIAGRYSSPKGRLLEIDARPTREGSWAAFHVALPVRDLRTYGALGFVLRGTAPDMQVIRACVRSGIKDGFADCFFDKHVLLRSEESSHVDALSVQDRPNLPDISDWRELVLFLPTRAFRASLIDLRVFLV